MGRLLFVVFALLLTLNSAGARSRRSKPRLNSLQNSLIAPEIAVVNHKILSRNGAEGALEIVQTSDHPEISSLFLPGSTVGHSSQACNVEAQPVPLPLTAIGAPQGMARYEAHFGTCSLSLDVLEGAVIMRADHCDADQNQCHIEANGLWGPPALRMNAQNIIHSEDQRIKADAAARTVLRRLMDVKPDPERLKDIIRHHIAFRIERDQQCRDYDGEARTGFCAARLSEAHAFALGAEYERARSAYEADQQHKKELKDLRAARRKAQRQHRQH
jgi:hypothetical protein